ncbi:hypothetical protein ABMA28_008992 [Loxostege sticticalis]|uniref:Peptidase S1 domain-containing protein n=1 Tax=Loxostege sticticalis TaxID=481309 RepID=A0ABD0SFF1_LOXSC
MWGYLVLVLAVAGSSAFAEVGLTYPEIARGFSSRIVSGWEAYDGQIPHQIGLRMVASNGGVFSCGASLIHNEWALTAAHCTAQRVSLVLRFGTVNQTRPTFIMESTEYYNHPDYLEELASIVQPHDIGVIKFRRRIEFNGFNVMPVRIQRSADKDKNYDQKQLVASGWGRTWTNGASPENLNWVFLRGVSNDYCARRYGFSSIIVPSTICASGYNVTSQSTCQGDSGGPLTIVDEDGELTVVGVTSFVSGTGCHTDFPAGFIRPGYYHDWFTEVTGIDFDWDFKDPESEGSTPAPENEVESTPGPEQEPEPSTPGPEQEPEPESTPGQPEQEPEPSTPGPEQEPDATTQTPETQESLSEDSEVSAESGESAESESSESSNSESSDSSD